MIKEYENIKEKLSSKLWKTRQQGFKELYKILEQEDSTTIISFREWAQYLNESDVQTQEEIFRVFKLFCLKTQEGFEYEEGMEGVIKGLLSGNFKEILALGFECFEKIFMNSPKAVLLTVNKLLLMKSNSILNNLIGFLTDLLVFYGPQYIGYETLTENLCSLFKETNINTNSKNKIMSFFKELYWYIGEKKLLDLLIKLKKPYISEIEEYIKKNPSTELKQPSKHLYIEIFHKNQFEEKEIKLSCKFNESWINQLLDPKKNWQNKRDMLDDLLLNLPNISKPHFEAIISQMNVMLKRLINDSNLNIVILAIKIIEKIYGTFQKEACNYAKGLMQLLMEKFKEKRSNIVEETHKALDSLHKYLNIEEHSCQTYFFEVLDSKNPNFRLNALIFFNNIVTSSNIEVIVPLIKKALDDQSQEIRDMAISNLKELYSNFGEKRLKPLISDLPNAKLLQILNKTLDYESSINNNTNTISSCNNEETLISFSKNEGTIRSIIEKIKKKPSNDIFVIQELDFLRMSKKMRVFQAESKKIAENDVKSNSDMIKIQFTQVFSRNFRDRLFEIDDKMIFLESLLELYENINFFIEGNLELKSIRDGLMKFETVSDLIIKHLFFIYKSLISKEEDNLTYDTALWIIKLLQLLIKVLVNLKQNFLEFEVKYLLNLSVVTFGNIRYQERFEDEIFKMLETLTALSLNSHKMTEFFLEEFRNSEPKAWKFRDQIIRLFSMVLIPKLPYFQLNLLQDYWEIISNRRIITAYKTKYSDLSNLPYFSSDFFDNLLLKSSSEKVTLPSCNENYKTFVLGSSIQPEWFDFCLDSLRNAQNLHEKIDSLLFLNDMATCEMQTNHSLFQKKTPKFLITFLLTLRETLIEIPKTSQFPRFFLNYLQKFLASGLLDMSHPFLVSLAEEIFFALVRNENENLAKLLNLCIMRVLEFGDIKVMMIGLWNLLIKYSKFSCYSLIYSLVNMSVLKLLKRTNCENFPFKELMIGVNSFVKQFKKINNQEDFTIKTIKCVLNQLIQIRGLEIAKIIAEIPDISDILLRWVNAISRPILTVDNVNLSEQEKTKYIEQIKEFLNRISNVGNDFDEILMKLVEICENGLLSEVMSSIEQIENDNLKKYLSFSLERLVFIKMFPFVAQENKIFHKKLDRKQGSNTNIQTNEKKAYDYRSKLANIYRDQSKGNINENNNINLCSNSNVNYMKNDEKTEENLINMLQQSEDYLDHPALEDLCNPFSSREFIDEENLVNFDEDFSAFTYIDDNNLININIEKNNNIVQASESEGNKNNEGFEEIESITSQHCDIEEFKEFKLTEIPEHEEFEES